MELSVGALFASWTSKLTLIGVADVAIPSLALTVKASIDPWALVLPLHLIVSPVLSVDSLPLISIHSLPDFF